MSRDSWYEQNKPPTKGERLSSNTEESPLLDNIKKISLLTKNVTPFPIFNPRIRGLIQKQICH